jgi:hypothetical protein
MKILIPFILVLTIASCKNNSPSASAGDNAKKADSAVTQFKDTTEKYRLVVMFYSIGEGTEYQFIKAFEDSIGSFSHKSGKKINYSKKAWGREGETDFCLKLNELAEAEKEDFIQMTRDLFKKAKWVNVYENYTCIPRTIR